MRSENRNELIFEILKEPWYIDLSDAEYKGVYELKDSTNYTAYHSYTSAVWWYAGHYNCVTITRPITILKRETLLNYKQYHTRIKPIKYPLHRRSILRI